MSEVVVKKNKLQIKGRFKGSKSEFLGNEPIGKLLWKMSYPAIIGMIVMSLYNLVDTLFIGWAVGPLGIAGISVVFPVQIIIMSFSLMTGIGSASLISRSMGAKNIKKAERVLGNFFSLSLIIGIILFVVSFIFSTQILNLFGSTPEIMSYAADYYNVLIFGSVFIMFAIGGNNVIRSFGQSKLAMYVMVSSALLNIALDAIFMFGFGMGMKGAAFATVGAFALSTIIVLVYFFRNKGAVKLHANCFRLNFGIIKETVSIGASSFARQFSAGIMIIVLNNALVIYSGALALAAFGIINRVVMFGVMPIVGLMQGMQPMVGFNFGAKKLERVRKTVFLSIKVSTAFAFFMFVLFILFPDFFVGLFSKDAELLKLGVDAMSIVILATPFVGFQIIVGGYFQAIGKAVPALVLSLLRQVILLIPLLFILPLFWGYKGILYAFPISDFIAVIISLLLFVPAIKKLKFNKF